jgi:hypothetical protein
MKDLRRTKWLAASCGMAGLAAVLSFGLQLPGNQTLQRVAWHQHGIVRVKPATTSAQASTQKVGVLNHYGQLPLAFEPANTTSNSEAKYLTRGNGYALFLANKEAVLELRGPSKSASVVRMELAGANKTATFSALELLPGKSNYFIGNDPAKWRTNVPQYRKVLESSVYPGVNLIYYGTQGKLEYDFDVAPGADPSVIQLAFQGATNPRIDAQGELVVSSPSGEVRLRKPVAYQEVAGERHPVAVSYAKKGRGRVAFQVAEYNPNLPLVIDPILIYSTYLGGSNIDTSNGIAVAPDNTAFVAGSTFSSDFPTAHPLQANDGGGPDFPEDAFVAKISSDGGTLLYSTYLGGQNQDAANGIAVDSFGDAFVIGYTLSPNFPVLTGSFETLCGGDGECGAKFTGGPIVSNAFVTKLNPAGSAIDYSTFYGQFQNVKGQAIAVDSNGNAYITGSTTENFATFAVFPITPTAFQTTFASTAGGNSTNAFVAVLNSNGTSALYSSYLGGEVDDVGYGIAVDNSANAYVTGLTYSTKFPVTTGALQSTYGGEGDAFVSKVSTTLSGTASLAYSTYLGGAGLDQGNAIAVDSSANVYVTGLTNSSSFSFSPSGVQPAYAGEGDAFVAKLNTTGALSFFTYLGGTHADEGDGIAVDSSDNIYITGTTASTDFPTAGAVFQAAYGGGNTDTFVAKIAPTGATLIYSSYLGGTNADLATGIAVDTSGSAYVTGQTCSDDFPLANPLQAVPGGNCDAYIAKISILDGFAFNPAGLVFPAQSLGTTSQSQTVTLTNGDTPQTISSIVVSGANAGDFLETSTCPLNSPLGVGTTCTFTVTFTPSASGIRNAGIVVTDTAPGSPQVLNLTGNTSTVSLSASALNFGTQAVGTVSPIQSVTVTNSGTTPLSFSSIVSSGDFFESDTCTRASLQPGSNCVVQVDFAPSAAIASIGTVTLTDNGSGSPQEITTTGTGVFQPPFQISSLSATPSVPAGNQANYGVSVTTNVGFAQQIGLSCSAPATITCSVAPNLVMPTTTQSVSAILTVSTALRTSAPPSSIRIDPLNLIRQWRGTWLLWMLAILMALTTAALRKRPISAAFGLAVVLMLASVACSGNPSGVPAGTPAGTYQITVTGVSGSITNSTTFALQVK